MLHQQTVTHDPRAGLTPLQARYADERRSRLARMSPAALRPAVAHPVCQPLHIEITECIPVETSIDVVECANQVILVSEKKVAEARVVFEWLSDVLVGRNNITVERIQAVVCAQLNMRRNDILSPRRHAPVVRARHIAMYLAKTLTLKSLPEIGRHFAGRDHTGVLHAVRKIERQIETDAELAADVATIMTALQPQGVE